jgi:hypothetical protein
MDRPIAAELGCVPVRIIQTHKLPADLRAESAQIHQRFFFPDEHAPDPRFVRGEANYDPNV